MKHAATTISRVAPIVSVVDDDAQIRHAVRRLLGGKTLHVETFSSGEEFLESFTPDAPGCLIMEIRLPLPGMSGIDLQRALNNRNVSLPLIFLTAHGDVPTTVQAMRAGALDVIEKPYRDHELRNRVQEALTLDRERRKADEYRAETAQRLASLTPRERQVMDQILKGMSNKEVGAHLNISVKTVEFHRNRLKKKLGIESLVDLARFAP